VEGIKNLSPQGDRNERPKNASGGVAIQEEISHWLSDDLEAGRMSESVYFPA
jgi:hypothetical protein